MFLLLKFFAPSFWKVFTVSICFICLYLFLSVLSVFICFYLFLSDTWFYLFYLFYLFYQFLSVLSAIKIIWHFIFAFWLLTFDMTWYWHNYLAIGQLVNNIGLIKISKNCKDCIRGLPIVLFVLFFMSKLSCLSSCSSPRPPPPSPSCPSPSQLSWTCAYCGPEIFFYLDKYNLRFGQIQFDIWTNTFSLSPSQLHIFNLWPECLT